MQGRIMERNLRTADFVLELLCPYVLERTRSCLCDALVSLSERGAVLVLEHDLMQQGEGVGREDDGGGVGIISLRVE